MNAVATHYDLHAEREWERLERHRTEYAVTLRALAEHLPPPPARILDVGSGPGRYAIALAQQGYFVTLVDLSRRSLDLAQLKAAEAGIFLSSVYQADAADLPDAFTASFDAVLLLGPLYHLLSEEARLRAVRGACRALVPGGVVYAAFISRYAPLRDVAIHSPGWIIDNPERFAQLVDHGLNPAGASNSFTDSYFAHPSEIIPLMETGGFSTRRLIALEGLVAGHEETVNELEGETWEAWVDLNYRLGHDPVVYGAADHLLYIGRRPGQADG
jgi:SAM-dependent methyltransferase